MELLLHIYKAIFMKIFVTAMMGLGTKFTPYLIIH